MISINNFLVKISKQKSTKPSIRIFHINQILTIHQHNKEDEHEVPHDTDRHLPHSRGL